MVVKTDLNAIFSIRYFAHFSYKETLGALLLFINKPPNSKLRIINTTASKFATRISFTAAPITKQIDEKHKDTKTSIDAKIANWCSPVSEFMIL